MNLFGWDPKGHGQYSFYVLAETEAEALRAVQHEVDHIRKAHGAYPVWGWGTDYYELTVYEAGTVIVHEND